MKKRFILFAIVAFAALTVYNVAPIQTAKADTGLEYWYAYYGLDPETNTISIYNEDQTESGIHLSVGSCFCDGVANCRYKEGTPCTERDACSVAACVTMAVGVTTVILQFL